MRNFLFAIGFAIVLQACEKIEPTSDDLPISYSFSDPINIKITNPTNKYGGPVISQPSELRLVQESINESYMYTLLRREVSGLYGNIINLSIQRSQTGSISNTDNFRISLPAEFYDFGNTNDFGYIFPNFNAGNPVSPLARNIPTQSLFSIDVSQRNIYVLSKSVNDQGQESMRIIKWSLEAGVVSDFVQDEDLLNSLIGKQLKCMRIDDAGDLYIASMANNGSIVKVSSAGTVTLVASNLINPGFFQIHDGSIYVPINSATEGRIVKFDKDGTRSDVIANITGPTNVVVDNHENIILRSQTTLNGADYYRYDIYGADGFLIANITDGAGYSILSNAYENMPMHIDSFNNLYFYHADGVGSEGTSSNNPTGQKGIFKIGLIKD